MIVKEWFSLFASDQKDLIEATAGHLHISQGIIEKDLWLVAILKAIFSSEKYKDQFIFKGGTSLSKVFNAIHRFSEDIDLIMNWNLIGYSEIETNPWAIRSRTQQDKFNKEMQSRADAYLAEVFSPWLQKQLSNTYPEITSVVPIGEGKIEVRYPAFFPVPYVRDTVLLEIGPLASWVPSIQRNIRTYVAESYPHVIAEQPTPIVVTTAERTFWEKATIAHQVAYNNKIPALRYSRHYYDLYMLSHIGIADSAISDIGLLHSVSQFKDRFYPSKKARYDLAVPGTLRLIPNQSTQQFLKDDYLRMQVMFFQDPPPWEQIMRNLKVLESRINSLRTR